MAPRIPWLLHLLWTLGFGANLNYAGTVQKGYTIADCRFPSDGILVSPSYPQSYSSQLNCTYRIIGQLNEWIQIIFKEFHLHSPPEAADYSYCDEMIEDTLIFKTTELQGAKSVFKFCRFHPPPKRLMSTGNIATILFITNHRPSDSPSQIPWAFRLEYNYMVEFNISNNGRKILGENCGRIFNGNISRNGSVYSPNYPGFYPRFTTCNYNFQGRKDDKVELSFYHFDLFGNPPCSQAMTNDLIAINDSTTARMEFFCGKKRPHVMRSTGSHLLLTFQSNQDGDASGFFANYRFLGPLPVVVTAETTNVISASSKNVEFYCLFYFVVLFTISCCGL